MNTFNATVRRTWGLVPDSSDGGVRETHTIVGQVTLGIDGVLLAVGGLIGDFKAGSRPSLIAGLLSAVAAFAALGLSIGRSQLGPPPGLLLSIVLFGYRYAIKTGQFMPGGLLAVISLVVLGVMFLTIDWRPQPAAGARARSAGSMRHGLGARAASEITGARR